jgi:hypothetical protein
MTIVVGHHSDASRNKTAMFLAPFNCVPIQSIAPCTGAATPVQSIAAGCGAEATTEVSVSGASSAGAAAIDAGLGLVLHAVGAGGASRAGAATVNASLISVLQAVGALIALNPR